MLPVSENAANHEKPRIAYETDLGTFVLGQVERVLVTPIGEGLSKKVDLIFTSPPFPLNTKKRYGNLKRAGIRRLAGWHGKAAEGAPEAQRVWNWC